MSRTETFFRRNASIIARHDAAQDCTYRVVWAVLAAQHGVAVANANYAAIRWITGIEPSEGEILKAYADWKALEQPRRFIPFDRSRLLAQLKAEC